MARIIGKGVSFEDVLIVPQYNRVNSRKEVNFTSQVTRNYQIDIPILAANMDTICESEMAVELGQLGGLGVIHRFMSPEEQSESVLVTKGYGLTSAAAIGVKDTEERVERLAEQGVDILVIDIAHGHSKRAGKTLDYLKREYPTLDVIAGNIATKDAAKYFLSKGADAVKVGIGPGKVCTTRTMTGVGVPQLTAIMDVYEGTQGEIPICADGGIRNPSDLVKALGAGANTIMSGYIFAGTDETPTNGIYRGSSLESDYVEGEEIEVESRGPIEPIIRQYLNGLASGMTYIGADRMDKLVGKVDFIEN